MKKKNFTEGAIFTPMLTFTMPIILTNILQTMYSIADNVIVGKFSGDTLALAAVGTSGSLSSLFLNIVIGLSTGCAVVIAHAFGASDKEKVSKSVHTALTFALIFGIALSAFSITFTKQMLVLTGVSSELMSRAHIYLVIIFAGLPATAIYNFSAAILRSVGDSRTSLIILTSSGILNVVLNIVFVTVFNMSADGVALATTISKYAAAFAVVAVLIKRKSESYALSLKKLGISKPILLRMLRFGVPNCIQSSVFSFSNVLITSALNGLETHVLSARTIAMNLTNIANNVSSSYTNATMTFVGQNYGAKKKNRIRDSLLISLLQSVAVTLIVGLAGLLFVEPISMLYIASNDPAREAIIAVARSIAEVTLPFYFICSIMNALSGTLRGIGCSFIPMIISVVGICGFRIIWIYTAFATPEFHSAKGLYLCYPISWIPVIVGFVITLLFCWRGVKREAQDSKEKAKSAK